MGVVYNHALLQQNHDDHTVTANEGPNKIMDERTTIHSNVQKRVGMSFSIIFNGGSQSLSSRCKRGLVQVGLVIIVAALRDYKKVRVCEKSSSSSSSSIMINDHLDLHRNLNLNLPSYLARVL